MRQKNPFVSVVVVNHNGRELLNDCFDSLRNLNYPKRRLEFFMVDNVSHDNSIRYVRRHYPEVNILKNTCNNYCKANNLGIKRSKGNFVALLNNDTKVDRDWLSELIKVTSKNSNIGAVGSKILLMDGRINSVGHEEFPYCYWGDKGFLENDLQQYEEVGEIPSVSNCAALYRREALEKVGLFDEDFCMYMEDVDISFRLKQKKWGIAYTPFSKVFHKLHGSKQSDEDRSFYIEKNRLLFVAKHFPEKLEEIIIGYGEIERLRPYHFQSLLVEIFHKLIKHHGDKKARYIYSNLNKQIKKLYIYNQHSLRVESEKADVENQRKMLQHEQQTKTQQDVVNTKENQINDLTLKIGNSEEQLKNLSEKINWLHEEVKNRDEFIKNQRQILEANNSQIKDFTVGIKVGEEKNKSLKTNITELNNKVTSYEQQTKTQQDVINAKESQINDLTLKIGNSEEQLKNLSEKINGLHSEVKNRDEFIKNQRQILEARKKQIKHIISKRNILEEKLKSQNNILNDKNEYINIISKRIDRLIRKESHQRELMSNRERRTTYLIGELKVKNEQIEHIKEKVLTMEDQVKAQKEDLKHRENRVNGLTNEIEGKNTQLESLSNELKKAKGMIVHQSEIINQKDVEISSIYNSETYRLIVSPVLWPLMTLLKKLAIPFQVFKAKIFSIITQKKLYKLKKNISITQLLARSIEARYLQKNDYTIKVMNGGLKEEKINLLVKILPNNPDGDIQKYYAYFAIEVNLNPNETKTIAIGYDWEMNVAFSVNNEIVQPSYFNMDGIRGEEMYKIEVIAYNEHNNCIDKSYILQKLK